MQLEIKEPSSNMKLKVLNIIIGLFIMACCITSCLDSDVQEYELSSNSSITAFSITDSIITRYPAVVNGKDTTLSKSVVGKNYPFVINQNEGLIYNPDSLPMGTDVSKVVIDIAADTEWIYIVAEKDSVWNAEDSLSFVKPIQFKVLAQNGTFGRIYTAKINVSQQDPELLAWSQLKGNFSKNIQAQKAVYMNNHIYVFGDTDSQVVMTMTSTQDGKTWSEPTSIDIPVKADYTSAMAWGNQLYMLADGELYTSENGLNWAKAETTQRFSKLLANIYSEYSQKLVGVDANNYYIESTDGLTWDCYEAMPANFPTSQTVFASYALDTNDKLGKIIVLGNSPTATDTTTVAWTQLNDESYWTELSLEDNRYACPNFENIHMIHYNDMLYAFGGAAQHKGAIDAFTKIYASEDDGISWSPITEKILFPEEFNALYDQAEGNYSCIVDDQQYIWIMWGQTGEVWRGRINKLGFDKQ